uniref:Two-component response regulator-like APRR2 n=1 Tax=Fagus sylvatica TaxID=28930 RepID=A0A2N9HU22_FAGSY
MLEWKDFPKGLRVLLLDGDSNSAEEIRSKLEEMDYIVSTLCNANEALSAILNKPGSFHVAIVEVGTSDSHGSFKFLETAKDLPTIMTSDIHCLSTMMKCIAHGAVEFLQKPLSEDKLRNIWQHVVHKCPCYSYNRKMENLIIEYQWKRKMCLVHENDNEHSAGSDKYPAPSTPQLKQGARLLDDGDCHDQTNCSTEKENGKNLIKEEEESVDGFKSERKVSPHQHNRESLGNKGDGCVQNPSKASGTHNSCGARANRKKMKVDWTPELHKKFVHAVEQLGVDHAIPSRILELMKVEDLTRHNVASHLQKYRMHRRHILPKEEERRWPRHRDVMQRSYYPQRPIMAFPPYHSNHTAPVYPIWGQPGSHPAGVHMWGPRGYPAWQPTDNWHWKPYPGMPADAWGCPVLPPPHNPYTSYPQNASGFHHAGGAVNNNSCGMPQFPVDLYPAQEVIDKVVKEAISKPWLPLPLGAQASFH